MNPKDKPDPLDEILIKYYGDDSLASENSNNLKAKAKINSLYISREEALEAVGEKEIDKTAYDSPEHWRLVGANELRAEIRKKLEGDK